MTFYSIFWTIFVWQSLLQLPTTLAINNVNEAEICPYQNTVNLTNLPRYENGSYEYNDIVIPPEKQRYYNYDIKFHNKNVTVEQHLRGCVCELRPCIKLCCELNEYLEIADDDTVKCEKITSEMKISWFLPIQLKNEKIKRVHMFKHFTPQIGLPCKDLEEFDIKTDKYMMKEDGNLSLDNGKITVNTLDYCYSLLQDNVSEVYVLTPFSCAVVNVASPSDTFNSYMMALSVIFLILTIVVYLVIDELRGSMQGKFVICYLLSLTVGYAIISFINLSNKTFPNTTCKIMGFTCYFFFMAAFLWLSALCHEISKNCRGIMAVHKRFKVYCLSIWSVAALATGIVIFIQLFTSLDDLYKPGIDSEMCWLNTKQWSAAIYFYGPNLLLLIFNFTMFIRVTEAIYHETISHENSIVIFRLFLIMGIPWIFDILSFCLRDYKHWKFFVFVFFISDFANATQGVLMFVLFVVKQDVLILLKNKFSNVYNSEPVNNIKLANVSNDPSSALKNNDSEGLINQRNSVSFHTLMEGEECLNNKSQ